MTQIQKGFASDNWSGVCPEIMESLSEINSGHIVAYGEGDYEYQCDIYKPFRIHFGNHVKTYFVYNGTAANVLGVKHIISSYHAIVAAHTAHLNEDECGAPEKFIGSKILEIVTQNGKITSDQVKPFLNSIGFQHHSQPKIISISQVTEMGTVYTPDEIKALSDFAHENDMYLHMDGARISNAAVALGLEFKEFTTDVGVDVLSFGGTKNGLMFGEAVVFLNPELAKDFEYTRKQGMQLHSKMRYISAQFTTYLTNDLWKRNASTANEMARLLASEISRIDQLKISQEVAANGVFVFMPTDVIPKLQEKYFFHIWNETEQNIKGFNCKEVRLMCSWDTNEEDIHGFVRLIKELLL